ncbi:MULTISPECIES: zinc ribbon domain-containing protein [Streptomyces]|uniref:Zinc ribbon domain-containing protein n=1 Tax=Streptomyces mirabilis TaxID=68239 RepID=A0ABU3V796_9ACTN|nr:MULTISPECIES: zinc ribbon domain-containing protein [Streptomyces]MCX4617595.1 zinc ribbon domain-containing protein [Streptomyces mirabilis]MCX5356929.1 zinc ribbon domain-containing protein [Streptomyces mirabilis]MDU9002044.1 zinc ribbon domain-containing protein [Streptomyces mirabilis]
MTRRIKVTAEYGTVVVEDLNVAGMLRNRRLARQTADAGIAEIRRQLAYKAQRNGCRTVAELHVRTYECDACGLVLDRDANAAHNLAALAAAAATGTGVAADLDTPKVSKPRGADRKTRTTPLSRKAGRGRAGGTTLPHQRQTETRDRTQAEALIGIPPWIPPPSGGGGIGLLRSRAGKADSPPGRIGVYRQRPAGDW